MIIRSEANIRLSFGQAADRPAMGDRRDSNTPTAAGTDEARNNHDWGWIGLIGLAGLGGLAGRRRREEIDNRDASERDFVRPHDG
jgi:MYXO-CTERM domain-containing protein